MLQYLSEAWTITWVCFGVFFAILWEFVRSYPRVTLALLVIMAFFLLRGMVRQEKSNGLALRSNNQSQPRARDD